MNIADNVAPFTLPFVRLNLLLTFFNLNYHHDGPMYSRNVFSLSNKQETIIQNTDSNVISVINEERAQSAQIRVEINRLQIEIQKLQTDLYIGQSAYSRLQ